MRSVLDISINFIYLRHRPAERPSAEKIIIYVASVVPLRLPRPLFTTCRPRGNPKWKKE